MRAEAKPETFYRKSQVLKRYPFSDTTLWRMCRDRKFPAPVDFGNGMKGWRGSQLDEYDASLKTAKAYAGASAEAVNA
jgi:predicted DNA-binding transcriptional regulator AlpA